MAARQSEHLPLPPNTFRAHVLPRELLPVLYRSVGGNVTDTDYDEEQRKAQRTCGHYSIAWLLFAQKYGAKNAKLI